MIRAFGCLLQRGLWRRKQRRRGHFFIGNVSSLSRWLSLRLRSAGRSLAPVPEVVLLLPLPTARRRPASTSTGGSTAPTTTNSKKKAGRRRREYEIVHMLLPDGRRGPSPI
ncbi:unnamed protein product [Victoria cruziana]